MVRGHGDLGQMTSAIGFALAALVFNGLTDVAFKQAAASSMAGRFKMHHFIVAQSVLFFSATTLYGFLAGQLVWGPHVVTGILAGFFMFAGFNCFAWSLRHGSISVNAPIFRLNFLVTAALAIVLLGETATPLKLGGLAAALLAIWLLLGAGGSERGPLSAEGRRSLALALLATLCLGIGNTIHKVGLSMGGTPGMQLAVHSFVYLVLSTIVAAREPGGLAVPAAAWPVALAGALCGAGSFIMMMSGMQIADASVIVPIAQMGLVVSAAIGVVVLGERFTSRKLAGLVAALAALAALAMS
jgi:drug/metabolite transporter (DMT)-like permease